MRQLFLSARAQKINTVCAIGISAALLLSQFMGQEIVFFGLMRA
jgi:hypothetical protein